MRTNIQTYIHAYVPTFTHVPNKYVGNKINSSIKYYCVFEYVFVLFAYYLFIFIYKSHVQDTRLRKRVRRPM